MSDSAISSPDVSSAEASAGSGGYASMEADLDSLDASSGDETTTEDAPAEEAESAGEADAESPYEPAEEEAESDDEPPPVDAEAAKPEEAKIEEELPEGVSVRDRNGKKEYVLKQSRYEKFHGAYATVRDVEQVFGEVLTPEVAEARQQAFIGQEMMLGDFMSGDPSMEGRFLNQLASWSKQAQELGEVNHSPLRNLAEKLPQFLEKADPQAYAAMAQPILRMTLDALYKEAAQPGNEDLFLSLQHIDNKKFGKYMKREQITAPDPLAEREARLAEREAQLKQVDTQRSQREVQQWENETIAKVRQVTADALTEALGPAVIKSYEKFPKELEGVKTLLQNEFKAAISKDVAWQQYLEAQSRRARNAPSPAIRQAIAEDLSARWTAKAKYWADRNPTVKEILTSRASAMKAQSDANHKRLQTGASRREPGSVGTPVRQTVRDTPNGKSGTDGWMEAIDSVL